MSQARSGLYGHRALSSALSPLDRSYDSPVRRTAGNAVRVPKNVRLFHIEGRGARVRIAAEHPDEETTGWLLARAIESLAEKGLGDGIVALRTDPCGPLGSRDWVDVYLQDMHRALGSLPFEDYLQCVYSETTGPPEEIHDPSRDTTRGAQASPSDKASGLKAGITTLRAGKNASLQNSHAPGQVAVNGKGNERFLRAKYLTYKSRTSSQVREQVRELDPVAGAPDAAAVSTREVSADRCVSNIPPSPLALSALETPYHGPANGFRTGIRKRQSDQRTQDALQGSSDTQRQVATCIYTHPSRPGGICVRHFRQEGVIGKGGFSVVYKVRKKDTGRLYAMKVVAKDKVASAANQIRRALSERDVLKQCDSPFVVRLFWAFQTQRHLFLVNEFCPGGDLFQLLRDCQFFPENVSRFVFAEVLLGLSHLHERNILYRDLKAENVLVDLDGHCRLADFGLSKTLSKGHQRSYSFCGSPEYLSPEMLLGTGHDKTLDYYGIGCLLYEMLTGIPPHYSSNRNCMYSRILEGNLSFPSSSKVSAEARDLVQRLLHVDPARRLGTGQAGVESLFAHPWLQGVDWKRISERTVPSLLLPYLQRQRLGIGRSPDPMLRDGTPPLDELRFPTFSSSDFSWEAPATCPFRHFDWENKRLLNEASERCSLVVPAGDSNACTSAVLHVNKRNGSRVSNIDKTQEAPIIHPYTQAHSAQADPGGAERIPVKTGRSTRIPTLQIRHQPGLNVEHRHVVLGPSGPPLTVSVAPAVRRGASSFSCSMAPCILSHHTGGLSMPTKAPRNSPILESNVFCLEGPERR
uniref:AGC kinase, putative n=2 Tax=Neospora caninum (strain Liverpool) TaxID=572307 RepID=A0A0F7UEU0_NEOCL|nr:TPA: AGC kinase, putative [Neospora caninum Liverpool]